MCVSDSTQQHKILTSLKIVIRAVFLCHICLLLALKEWGVIMSKIANQFT